MSLTTKTISVFFALALPLFFPFTLMAQTILNADGPGNTFELITSILAPGYHPIETPECRHPEFGRHIDEIWDASLQAYVFRFHMHVSPDDDRCINADRQRNEIKTYAASPDHLQGTLGETVIYRWKFKLDKGFQPSKSFTHLHQIKAVGGTEASMPQITLTPRAGTPDSLQLLYAKANTQVEIASTNLDPFKGVWVDVTETITYGEVGAYQLSIRRINDGAELFFYTNQAIRMWKTKADFMRPKWGIYRSLKHPEQLRDEQVRFTGFSIEEIRKDTPRPEKNK